MRQPNLVMSYEEVRWFNGATTEVSRDTEGSSIIVRLLTHSRRLTSQAVRSHPAHFDGLCHPLAPIDPSCNLHIFSNQILENF